MSTRLPSGFDAEVMRLVQLSLHSIGYLEG